MMLSEWIFPTTPVSVYPADDLPLPERRRARRDLTRVPPTPVVWSANFGWVGFLVVCFLYKVNPNPRKISCCGKTWPKCHFLTYFFLGWVVALGWGVRRFHDKIYRSWFATQHTPYLRPLSDRWKNGPHIQYQVFDDDDDDDDNYDAITLSSFPSNNLGRANETRLKKASRWKNLSWKKTK